MHDIDDIVERLRVIEEDLRDRAYAALRDQVEGDADSALEKRLNRARRAVERAIAALGGLEDIEE